jgi:ABC-2 type transport system ATP-binding protein
MALKSASIAIDNLVKRYGEITAIDRLSLNIKSEELFGLLGPNGAGKTTTINVLCGLVKPTSGTVKVAGYDVQKEAQKIHQMIGVCPQDTAITAYLTGRENAELFGKLYGMQKPDIKNSVDQLFKKMGLIDDANRRAGNYSGGMKRRLNLIMALVHDPEILFLDEPTVGMDPQSRLAVWDFIREIRKRGKTILLTTHYMEEAEQMCDRVGIIDHGKLIALGTPKQLNDKYKEKNLEDVFIHLTGRKIREE